MLRRLFSRKFLGLLVATFVVCCFTFALIWVLFPFDFEKLERFPASTRIFDREGRLLRVYSDSRGEMRFPVELEEISPWLRKATVAVEDRRFRSHLGVDLKAVVRAALQNLSRLEVHSGASTITMQLVRLVEPRPRHVLTKAVEAFRSLQIEARLSKDEILCHYLNLAPYGGNLRGVEAAALRYFGKSARELSLGEAALLAGLPQSPSRLRPDRSYERALDRRRVVLHAMLCEGMIGSEEYEVALQSRPRVRLHLWPFRAPHFSDLVRRTARSAPGGNDFHTTLDISTQTLTEKHLGAFFQRPVEGRRDLSGAAVVLEVESGAVRALVGSPEFFNPARQGQVNGALAPRSTGSALKPFLYALSFDRGMAAPSTYLADVPTPFNAYLPENFSRTFHGPVSAKEALALSLNVPAVRLLERVGTADLLAVLRKLGLSTFEKDSAHYGLSLALGGGEARLLDLANAYAVLPRLGLYKPYRVLKTAAVVPVRRVVGSSACRLLLDCLSGATHLERATGRRPQAGDARLAYKTGTSFGLRDAWTFAFSTEHVVAVWIGDPRGNPRPGLVGLETAAPIALAVLEGLSARAPSEWPGAKTIRELEICAVSGYPVGAFCPTTARAFFAASGNLPSRCDVHRAVLVDETRGVEICRSCRHGREARQQVVEAWPHEVGRWIREQRGGEVRLPHDPHCSRARRGERPRILSPADGVEFRLLAGASFPQNVPLRAAAADDASALHWFVDGELVGTGHVLESLSWRLRPGRHEVRCVDDQGRAATVEIQVSGSSKRASWR